MTTREQHIRMARIYLHQARPPFQKCFKTLPPRCRKAIGLVPQQWIRAPWYASSSAEVTGAVGRIRYKTRGARLVKRATLSHAAF